MPLMTLQNGHKNTKNSIYYQDSRNGDCPPVLLLHGLGSNSSSWQLQIPVLVSQGFRPISVDIPGFGQSTYCEKNWTVANASRLIEEFILKLGKHPLTVIGISMGGTIALQLVVDRPDLVSNLVLVNTFASLLPMSIKGWLYFLKRAVLTLGHKPESQAAFVVRRIFPEESQAELRAILFDQIIHTDPQVYKQAMRSLGLFNLQDKMKTIKVRTQVITGGADTTVPLTAQSKLVNSIPQATQTIIPGAGHAVIVDHPDEFNRVMMNFLSQASN